MSAGGAKGETRIEEPTAAERAIARRAAEARATVPDLELRADVDVAKALELRDSRGCSIPAILVRACALALKAVPRANGAYRDGRFELYSRVNIGIVAADEHSYLIPTVFDADQKSLTDLTDEIERVTGAARAGELSPPAYAGATFTLWDAGALGIPAPTIVVNSPQAAALAAGAVRPAPVVRDGTVTSGHLMTITLACDHRILYGAQAARFLAEVTGAMSAPDM
ncbi:MAG TPA: 2-oxo acid dehydrogenase subunit E2 [Solirubrobacteraceae bacterium]|nr:2-oxo acid dehydrogenase subunit E2 [Solirubrobacteraceae bacterium]